ncbi:MAG: GYF domain-containing protein [Muribaculaceae bacterium]|nr:GYF domain-containing protein [Muribaculaceae bacterium]
MKFFARIDDTQVGPLGLGQLIEAGVRPSTYVWHKGMADWEKAEDVPEVCRAMRRALAGLDPETGMEIERQNNASDSALPSQEEIAEAEREAASQGLRGLRGLPEPGITPDYSRRPQGVSVIGAIIATLMCFPLTGLVAIWYAMKCQAHWKMSEDPQIKTVAAEQLRRQAHEDARIYRMMMGITFCLGIIMVGFAFSRMMV